MCLVLAGGCARKERPVPPYERPMYGGQTSAETTAADVKRNAVMIRQLGSREAAVNKTLDEALATYQRGYFELATHRYNQAWLMDPSHPEVFNGFALVLDALGKEDEALGVYQKCLDLNPDHAMTLARLARQYQNKMVRVISGPASNEGVQDEAARLLEEALRLYAQAAKVAKLEVDLSFITYQWAIALAVKQDYAGAWEKVHLSKTYGGQFVEAKFIEALSKDMPETSGSEPAKK